ncbi:MAG: hypothetical protein AB4911_22415 [Oscillochloridaceae bacterium umkhey_bin13]
MPTQSQKSNLSQKQRELSGVAATSLALVITVMTASLIALVIELAINLM